MALILIAGMALAACGSVSGSEDTADASFPSSALKLQPTQASESAESTDTDRATKLDVSADPAMLDPDLVNRRVEDFDAYLPPRLIGPDGIRPIYDPQFVSAADAPLDDDELVIGVTIDGEAKAYPITVLRFREMVNDELGNLPILVTW
jgi:hypothetical protein